jgi:glycolate oxidase FAD binding subunit
MSVDMRDVRVGGTSVRGTLAKRIVSPTDLGEAARILANAAERDESVAFLGGGTELGLGYAPSRVDVLVKTSQLNRVVEYAPADMVVEVECGITLAELQRALAPHGQRLALDAPYPELATIGGLVATNAFGPRRMRFGTLRDLIVGVSLVRADGERVRGGGKVVKNVAGFDLPKLAVGSLGSLGMIATATFRLHPTPQATRVLRVGACDGPMLAALSRELFARKLEPAAFVAVRNDARASYDAYALFEGFESGAEEQALRFETLARDCGLVAEPIAEIDRPNALDEETRTHGDVRVRVAVPPADVVALERDALAPLARALRDTKTIVYPALGVAFLSGYAADVAAVAPALLGARGVAEGLHGNLVVTDVRDRTLSGAVDPFGTLPSSFFLMRRLKERFDPARRLNPGRFLGGL